MSLILPNKSLLGWLTGFICWIWAMSCPAQAGFYIEDFGVEVRLMEDGSFQVVENIQVVFTERRRGILRNIPTKSEVNAVTGELALNHFPGQPYYIYLDQLSVQGHPYSVSLEESETVVKIGDPDVFLEGPQTYQISYRVYGAINEFMRKSEFYWNVTGNHWNVPINHASLDLHLPTSMQLSEGAYEVFTGKLSSQEYKAQSRSAPGHLHVETTERLGPYEGMTVGATFPKGYLKPEPIPLSAMASDYYVLDHRIQVQLMEDQSVMLAEDLHLVLKEKGATIERVFPFKSGFHWRFGGSEEMASSKVFVDNFDRGVTPDGDFGRPVSANSSYDTQRIIWKSYDVEVGDTAHLQAHYRLYGAVHTYQGQPRLYLPLLSNAREHPVGHLQVELSLPEGYHTDTPHVSMVSRYRESPWQVRHQDERLILETTGPVGQESLMLAAELEGPAMQLLPIPVTAIAPDNHLRSIRIRAELEANGWMHVRQDMVHHLTKSDFQMNMYVDEGYQMFRDSNYMGRKPQMFGWDGNFRLKGLSGDYTEDMDEWQGWQLTYLCQGRKGHDAAAHSFSYSLYGFLADSTGKQILDLDFLSELSLVADSVELEISLPDNILVPEEDIHPSIIGRSDNFSQHISVSSSPGLIRIRPLPGLDINQGLRVRIFLPGDSIGSSWSGELGLVWTNNPWMILPWPILLLMWIFWWWKGRDKPFTVVPRFRPPADLTPAEAGLLVDDKLHNRDLLAMFYYWGAKGYLSIEEVTNIQGAVTNYKIKRLRKLPGNARGFEKVLFNGLFSYGNTIKVSSLKNKFYPYMSSARAKLESETDRRQFFVPKTRGFGRGMRTLAILVGIIALVVTAIDWFSIGNVARMRLDYTFGGVVIALGLYGFSRIMSKRAPYGQEKYEEIAGYLEFLRTADGDRLKRLVDEDPAYFGESLAYAIAFGIASEWVSKFDGLLAVPPSYYHSSASSFHAGTFNTMLTNNLDTLSKNLNSIPASSGGGYSSGSSSYSSSSYSSSSSSSYSSSSSGSSYSSGGGSSGGGYGGGGGSSW